jgi:hypothetical protein
MFVASVHRNCPWCWPWELSLVSCFSFTGEASLRSWLARLHLTLTEPILDLILVGFKRLGCLKQTITGLLSEEEFPIDT